jgi:quinolinate synthase
MSNPETPQQPIINPIEVPPHPQWPELTADQREKLISKIKMLLQEQDAVLVAHYYTDPEL